MSRVDMALEAIARAEAKLDHARAAIDRGDLANAVRIAFEARSLCGAAKTHLEEELDIRTRIGLTQQLETPRRREVRR